MSAVKANEQLESIWKAAQAKYEKTLSAKELKQIKSVSTKEALLDEAERLNRKYHSRKSARSLTRIHPVIAQIESFSAVIKTFIQADPGVTALVWGSIFFIIELATRHSKYLDEILSAFELFDRDIPRFHHYTGRYGLRQLKPSLTKALVHYYAGLIGICQDSIRFLRNHPLKNILLGFHYSTIYHRELTKRVSGVREAAYYVDLEATIDAEDERIKSYNTLLQQFEAYRKKAVTADTSGRPRPFIFHNIPNVPNPRFFGREQHLQCLSYNLDNEEAMERGGLRCSALWGMGGVGKTQIVMRYAYESLDMKKFDTVFWIAAETPLKLAKTFAEPAYRLGLVDNKVTNLFMVKEAFLQWLFETRLGHDAKVLGKGTRWLLIFDNVEDAKVLEKYWPSGAVGAVILTTRNPDIAKRFADPRNTLEVSPFAQEEAESFLQRMTAPSCDQTTMTGDSRPKNWIEPDSSEFSAIRQIASSLGCLPLVLDIVGSYVASNGMSYDRFLTVHQDFGRGFVLDSENSVDTYQSSTENTWTFVKSYLAEEPLLLLQMLAFLDPDGVPTELFEENDVDKKLYNFTSDGCASELLSNPLNNPQILEKSVSTLCPTSCIRRDRQDNKIRIHRVVQAAVAKRMSAHHRFRSFHLAVIQLNAVFPQQQADGPLSQEWNTCALYLTQVTSLWTAYFIWKHDIGSPILLCEVSRRASWYLYERGRGGDSENLLNLACNEIENAAKIGVESFRPRYINLLTADLYALRGTLEFERNKPGHGLAWFLRVSEMRSGPIGQNDQWDVTDCGVGLALLAEDRLEEAFPLLSNLAEKSPREEMADKYQSNLALCYFLMGRYKEANEACIAAMEISETKDHQEHMQRSVNYFYLGNIHLAQRHIDEAFDAFSTCLEIRVANMPNHHLTGFTYHKLGVIARGRGDLESAAALFKKGLEILTACDTQPGGCARSAHELQAVLELMGRFEEAKEVRMESMKQRDKILWVDKSDFEELKGKDIDEAHERLVLFCNR